MGLLVDGNRQDRWYDTGKAGDGVYKSGFATTQEAYEEAVVPLFETLDWLDPYVPHGRG